MRIDQYLVERETLNAEEILVIMRGEDLPPMLNSTAQKTNDKIEKEKAAEIIKSDGNILEPAKP